MTLLQQLLLPSLKAQIPGFIQAMSVETIEDKFNEAMELGMTKFISTDCSGFDSCQHVELKQAVEDPIWDVFMDFVERLFNEGSFFQAMDTTVKTTYLRSLRNAYKRHVFDLVIPAPGLKSTFPLTPGQASTLAAAKVDPDDACILTVHGTTPSGHCGTTINNTLRMLAYALFDAHSAGCPRPWSEQ